MSDIAATTERLKRLIVESLNLEDVDPAEIGDDEPLVGDGLAIDSVDVLELIVAMEKEFGIRMDGHEIDRSVFASVRSLAEFVQQQSAERTG